MSKIVITEGDIRRMVNEAVRALLREHYHGPLYHWTDIDSLMNILCDNALLRHHFPYAGPTPNRRGVIGPNGREEHFISFTRNKNYNVNGWRENDIDCRLTFDADELMTLRNAKLYPYNDQAGEYWDDEINNFTESHPEKSESEEVLYGTDVAPLDKYVKSVDIFINKGYDGGDMEYIDFIMKNVPLFKDKIHIIER